MQRPHSPSKSVRTAALPSVLASALLWMVTLAIAQVDPSSSELTLYGMRLKDAPTAAFISAATAAGAKALDQRPDGPTNFDTRDAGVPALQRLTLIADRGSLVSAQFVIKPYGQDNEALRQLLVQKYGLPTMADGARRPFPGFAGRFAPRGSFDWDFAGGMKLIYRQPALGDATLSYTDVEKAGRLAASATTPVGTPPSKGDLGNRF
ncbi:MAG: hypothetical protein QFE16_01675 [Pseudomonadota bacterium]|nr:hypothetical protein [Pseudomonadota bacterium]